MANAGLPLASDRIWNVPNSLSLARLLLALLVGVMIEYELFLSSMIVFLVAAATDALDGWWARKFNQMTKLGRILDPFVDKIIITSAMVSLVGADGSGISAWMVTLIIGRELLVTSLRATIEGRGGDFSARWLGKWKMVVQCAAIVASLWLLYWSPSPMWLVWTTSMLAWLAVLITIASGADYVVQAIRVTRQPDPAQSSAR
jgi:CDP-diacylglycerol--glycerol-3-phosphate 3-phosphatidyltransferase